MPDVYRETRSYTRDRDSSPSDDEYKRTTVRRYKVTPNRAERVERIERDIVVEDDRRSHYSSAHLGAPARSSHADLVEVDRRVERTYAPDRPRSAIDAPTRHRDAVVERVERVERDRDGDEYYSRTEYRDERPHHGSVVEREKVVEREERAERDFGDRHRTVIERDSREEDIYRLDDRDRDRDRDRGRVVYEKTKEVDRVDVPFSPRDRDRRELDREWDRRSAITSRDRDEVDVRVDKRYERREDGEVLVERRVEERRDDGYGSGAEVERYRKETEYYQPAPAPAPIVIRQRAPEQKIIVQEAPPPAPIYLPRQEPTYTVVREQESRELARRDPRDHDHEDEYYYRRESREVGPYRGDRREEDLAIARYDRRGDHYHRHHRHHRHRDDYSDPGSEEDYYVRRTIVRRERSSSGSPHRKRHLAEGALAGAGLAGLLASRRNGEGDFPEHRGRKVLTGAVLGALGTEVARRARSAYNDRYADDDDRRSRSRSRGHSRLRTGLGIAAVALAAAGAAKYYQSNKIEKEEMSRGRSLRRTSSGEISRSVSRKRSRSRAASVAKAAVGTAAVAGLVNHFRNKSKSRDGKSRSRSRLRTGAGIVAAGLAGAAGKKIYDNMQDKKERKREEEAERARSVSRARSRGTYSDVSDYDRDYRHRRHDSRSRSRSRSISRSGRPLYPPAPPAADPELGLVEYGAHPLYQDPPAATYAAGVRDGYVSAEEERAETRRRGHRKHRSRSRGGDGYASDSESEGDPAPKKKRSKSRIRDLAAGAAAAGAAAIGLKKYSDNKKEERERSRDRKSRDRPRDRDYVSEDEDDRHRHRSERERDHERDRDRDRDRHRDGQRDRDREREEERRRYEEEIMAEEGYNRSPGLRTPSPPHASGGFAPPPGPPAGFTQHPNMGTTNLNQGYQAYNPQEFSGFPPPPPGPPPYGTAHPGTIPSGGIQPPPPPPPPAAGSHLPPPPVGPERVSQASRDPDLGSHSSAPNSPKSRDKGERDERSGNAVTGVTSTAKPLQRPASPGSDSDSPTTAAKSVAFIPLSPQSSRTLRRHHAEHEAHQHEVESSSGGDSLIPYHADRNSTVNTRQRRGSDPSSNRPVIQRRRSRGNDSPDSELSEDEIEVLPDRFDAQGRPLDARGRPVGSAGGRGGDARWHTRQGDFDYRSPRGSEGWNVQGQWGIGSTDPEAVERMVRGVTSAIEGGRGGWLGLLGGLLHGLEAPPDDGHRLVEDERHNDRTHRQDEREARHGNTRHERQRRSEQLDTDNDDDGPTPGRRWWRRKPRE